MAAALALTLALAPSARSAEPGAVTDITWGTSTAEVDRTVSLLRESGAKWIRANISWASLEPSAKGSYSSGYLSEIDYAIGKARAAGLQVIMPMADGVPYWASADPGKRIDSSGARRWNKYYRPSSFQDYADAFRFVVDRYEAKGVHVFEVWNEPNLSYFWPSGVNAGEYTQLLKAAYPAAKQADPSATVLLGGLSQVDRDFLQGVYAAGGGSYFDAVSYHAYPTGDPDGCGKDSSGRRSAEALCGVEEVRSTMAANGDSGKDVWLTELGWSTCSNSYSGCFGKGVSESQQADYLTRGYRRLDGYPWIRTALWYDFRNTYFRGESPGDWNANLGLLRIDFSPKPAFEAFKAHATGAAPTSSPASAPPTGAAPKQRRTRTKLAVRRHPRASAARRRAQAAALASWVVVGGRVSGADLGKVSLRIERSRGGRWSRARTRMLTLDRSGRFRSRLTLPRGRYRAQAIYAGSARSAPSRSSFVRFRRIRGSAR